MSQWLVRRFVKNHTQLSDPAVRVRYGLLAGWVGIVCNLLLFGGKLIVGLLSGSVAITGDAVNNLSDASSSVVTLIGFRMAAKPADKEHPFGHARVEYIAGLAVAIMVLVIGIELGRSSVDKIINPSTVTYSAVGFVVLAASILLKLWMAVFNRSIGRKIGSAALEATFADSRNDVITTGAVLVAALIANYSGLALDGWMGLGVAVFILFSGVGLIKETMDPLLGVAPDPELVRHVADKISAYPGVLGTHDLIVHDYGPGRRFASAHVEMSRDDDVMKSHDTIDNIERDFVEQENIHLIIHYDPVITGDEALDTACGWVKERVKAVDERLTLHDFRMVDGPTHVNYIFDVVAPPDITLTDDALREKIAQAVQNGEKPVHTVITIDHSYAPIPN